jgi:hypothetical protein
MSLYRVLADVASWRIIDDEAVVIHTETSEYFGLNPSGTWLWARLAERAHSADELSGLLAERYGLAPEAIASHVGTFLERLAATKLVENGLATSGRPPADENGSLGVSSVPEEPPLDPYEPPEITRFGDLETLILSGE